MIVEGRSEGLPKACGKVLYAASTYYHVLIACIKQLVAPRRADILCTGYIPEVKQLVCRLTCARLFNQIFLIEKVNEYVPSGYLDLILNLHRRNTVFIEKSFPSDFRFENYEEINIFHDDTWMAHYLKGKRLHYRLMEDALDSCKNLSAGKFAYMLPKRGLKTWIKQVFHIGYLFFGEDGLADEIEVNEKSGVEFKSSKLIEMPKQPLFDGLTAQQWEVLGRIFLQKLPPLPVGRRALVLTQPLYTDGYVRSPEAQLELYERLAAKYLSGWIPLVKPHPRDDTNCAEMLPGAVVLDKNMPSELLPLMLTCDFSKFIPFPRLLPPKNGVLHPPNLGGYIKLDSME